MTAYRVILVQATVDIADDETYEQATERVQAALNAACPEGWRGVLSEAVEDEEHLIPEPSPDPSESTP